MTAIEYLALPWYKRALYKIGAFFTAIPKALKSFFTKKVPSFFVKIGKAIAGIFRNIFNFFVDGDWKTRVSFLVMGFGQITRGSVIRGLLNLLYEIAFIIFFVMIGLPNLLEIGTFGNMAATNYMRYDLGVKFSPRLKPSGVRLRNIMCRSLL